METILEVEGLKKTFRGPPPVTAADGLSFRLERGQTLGLVGASGCGKTTLARLLCRLTEPDAGKILLEGRDLLALKGRELICRRRRIQMVFQSPIGSFDPRQTLGAAIGESLANRGVPRQERQDRTAELLDKCGLPRDFARRYPHQLSGGQCQRGAIARALAADPAVLLLDEATSALDATVELQILELLARLQQSRNLSYLFISHSPRRVLGFCRQVLVMDRGKIVEQGPPEQVFSAPRTPAARALAEWL